MGTAQSEDARSGGSGRCGDSSRIVASRANKCCQPLSALLESATLRYLSFVTISSLRYVKQFSLSPEPSIRVYKTVVYFVIFFGKPLGPVARSMVSVNQRLIP